jgi:hypothetical protein
MKAWTDALLRSQSPSAMSGAMLMIKDTDPVPKDALDEGSSSVLQGHEPVLWNGRVRGGILGTWAHGVNDA